MLWEWPVVFVGLRTNRAAVQTVCMKLFLLIKPNIAKLIRLAYKLMNDQSYSHAQFNTHKKRAERERKNKNSTLKMLLYTTLLQEEYTHIHTEEFSVICFSCVRRVKISINEI